MKKLFLILSLLIFGCSVATAQSRDSGMVGSLGYSTGFVSFESGRLFSSNEAYVTFGYRFSDLFAVRCRSEFAVGLFEQYGVKDYARTGVIGVEAGLNLVKRRDSAVELSYGAGNTVGDGYWTYMYQDVAVRYYMGRSAHKIFYGVGVRYYNSENSNFDNMSNGYLTIGFTFN